MQNDDIIKTTVSSKIGDIIFLGNAVIKNSST